MLPDGSGGAFVATRDTGAIQVEHISGEGGRSATLRGPLSSQWDLVLDGTGGFYLAWRDESQPNGRVHLSRHSNLGQQIWTMPLFETQGGNELLLGLAAGGSGDAYVGVFANSVLRLTRIQSDGQRPENWPSKGVLVDGGKFHARWLVEDGYGGIITGFSTDGFGSDSVLAQRFDSTGSRLWSWQAASNRFHEFQTQPDRIGGTFVTWLTPEPAVHVTHLAIDGEAVAGWPDSGLKVSCGGRVAFPDMSSCSDGSDGIFVVWSQTINNNDLYALHLEGDGSVAQGWTRCGNLVSRAEGNQDEAVCVPDGIGGVFIAWQDWRYYRSIEPFAVRLAPDGTLVSGWSAGGMSIASPVVAFELMAVPDGTGGALVAWSGSYSTIDAGGIQRIRGDGVYGPRLTETGQSSIRMSTPWPNPFESQLEFVIDLPRAERLSVSIRDVMGRRVATLKHPDIQHAGPNVIRWRGEDQGGSPASPGVYFIDVHSESGTRSKRVVKIR